MIAPFSWYLNWSSEGPVPEAAAQHWALGPAIKFPLCLDCSPASNLVADADLDDDVISTLSGTLMNFPTRNISYSSFRSWPKMGTTRESIGGFAREFQAAGSLYDSEFHFVENSCCFEL